MSTFVIMVLLDDPETGEEETCCGTYPTRERACEAKAKYIEAGGAARGPFEVLTVDRAIKKLGMRGHIVVEIPEPDADVAAELTAAEAAALVEAAEAGVLRPMDEAEPEEPERPDQPGPGPGSL